MSLFLFLYCCSSVQGCTLLLKSLTQILFINSRNKNLKLSDIANLQNEIEVTMLLSFFKKHPKIIEMVLQDALTYMYTLLARCADGYSAPKPAAVLSLEEGAAEDEQEGEEALSATISSLSALVLYPLLRPVDARLVTSLRAATQVRGSDSLLGLSLGLGVGVGVGLGAQSEGGRGRAPRGRGRGGRLSSEVEEGATDQQTTEADSPTLLHIFTDKFKRKYYTILTKYFTLCCKQSYDIFKSFRDELSYQSALKELNDVQERQHRQADRGRHEKVSRRSEKNAFLVDDEDYSEGDDDDYSDEDDFIEVENCASRNGHHTAASLPGKTETSEQKLLVVAFIYSFIHSCLCAVCGTS
jgi:hypothetical protein